MYGTLSTIETLKSVNQTVAEFSEARMAEILSEYLSAHNAIMAEAVSVLVDRTTDVDRWTGSAAQMSMVRMDEYGSPDVQKVSYGVRCGFPLHSHQGALGWTRKYMQTATVSEMAAQFTAMQVADRRRVVAEIKRALFLPTNYTDENSLANRRTLQPIEVRRLVNADSLDIPPGPNGELFNSATHTHYLATASFVQANLAAALDTVLEHYNSGDAMIYIARAQEDTVRGFADFVKYAEPGYILSDNTTRIPGKVLNPIATYNRAIGEFRGAQVWVKPWMISSYVFVFMSGPPKPVAMRTRTANSGNLELVAENESYPLRANIYEREFGMGVQERTNGAVLYTGGGTYTAPTITD